MRLLVRTKLGRRFLVIFASALLAFISGGLLLIHLATEALRQQSYILLQVALDGAEAQVLEFLASLKRATQSRAFDPEIQAALSAPEPSFVNLRGMLTTSQVRMPEVQEIFCMNLQGKVVGSSSPEMLGTDGSSTVEFQRAQHGLFAGEIARNPESGMLQWRMSAPVRDVQSRKLLGVVVVGFDPGALNALTTGKRVLDQGANTQSFRMGDSGETYIVNREGMLLTESRFLGNGILSRKIDTAPVRAALRENKQVLTAYKDYRGVESIGASAIIKEMGWVIVTEIDFRQATAPIRTLRAEMIFMAVVAAAIGLLIAKSFNRAIIDPLRIAGEADRTLARGEESAALVPEGHLPRNEIGDFITQRNSNVRKLFDRERELLREQKRRTEAATALESLSYSMVHDMRAPLRTVSSFGDLLRQEAAERLNATEKDYLDRMKAACLQMDHLICDMLRYSSMLRAEVPLSPVNVSELVQRAIDADPTLKARAAAIRIDCNPPLVQGNGPLLTQCFAVLLNNALKYAKPDTPPRINVWEEAIDGQARVIVEDNGIGISERFQKRLFGIFQKGIPGSQGTGIGLALVRVAIERMGGRVGVVSEEGKGSRFWFELKLAG